MNSILLLSSNFVPISRKLKPSSQNIGEWIVRFLSKNQKKKYKSQKRETRFFTILLKVLQSVPIAGEIRILYGHQWSLFWSFNDGAAV